MIADEAGVRQHAFNLQGCCERVAINIHDIAAVWLAEVGPLGIGPFNRRPLLMIHNLQLDQPGAKGDKDDAQKAAQEDQSVQGS